MTVAKNTDEYISAFPNNVQKLLKQMRNTIKKAAPQAAETISYAMPTFTLNGNLVHFAGYKNHIGFYPAPSGIEAFKKELSVYAGAKGSVQFPLDKPLPLELITKIVAFRVAENMEKALKKTSKQSIKKAAAAETGKSKKQKASLQNNFLSTLPAPAKHALENNGINSLKKLSQLTEKAVLSFHGMGPSSVPKLKEALQAEGLSFKK